MQIDVHDLIWAIVNFLVLLAILYKVLYGPLVKMMDDRQNDIKDNITRAEQSLKDAEGLKTELSLEMEKGRQEAQEILARANKMGEDSKNEIISQAKDAAAKLSERAREEIQREKEQALADIRKEVAGLAVAVAGKVLAEELTLEAQEQLMDKFIQEVGEIQ